MGLMKYLVRFDFGLRDAFGEEVRLLTESDFEKLNNKIGSYIYLGEIEGKHSEVSGDFEKGDFTVMATYEDDSEFVKEWDKQFPQGFGIDIWYALTNGDNDGE
jgi:hypothetical protein